MRNKSALPLAVLASALSAAACAHAEPLSLSCRIANMEMVALEADQLMHEPSAPMSAEVFLSLDFDAMMFSFSSASGFFDATETTITMISRAPNGNAVYWLDRRSGAFETIHIREQGERTAVTKMTGQCEPESGTPF